MSLLAQWGFDVADGPCSDSSGAAQHLAYVGASLSVAGKIGGARRFDGVSQYIAGSPTSATRTAMSGNWTWCGWLKAPATIDGGDSWTLAALTGDLFSDAEAENILLWVFTSGQALSVSFDGTESAAEANYQFNSDASAVPTDGAWHHYAVVKDVTGHAVHIYRDGAARSVTSFRNGVALAGGDPMTSTGGANATWTLAGVLLGGDLATPLPGAIDDFRLYSTALSAADVLALYTSGAAMGAVSLTTLRARVREAFDMTGSLFVTDAATSLDAFINAAVDELYDVILQHFGEDYYVSSTSLTTTAGTSAYSLPSDFYKLLGVDLTWNGDSVSLEQFNFAERNTYKASVNSGGLPRYRLEGSNLRLYPAPDSVMSGTLWYVPTRALLVNGSDTISFPGGWEEYAVVDAAIRCGIKEESDVSVLLSRKAEQRQRIEAAASRRDAGTAPRITDVESGRIGDSCDPVLTRGWY